MSAQGIGQDKALTVLYRSPLPIGFQPLPCGWLLRPSISGWRHRPTLLGAIARRSRLERLRIAEGRFVMVFVVGGLVLWRWW